MSEKVKQVFYSINEEDFSYSDIGEVIDALDCDGNLELGSTYYSCEFEAVDFTQYLDVDNILERADEYLYDNIRCEDASPFADVTKEAKDNLKTLLHDWAKRHVTGRYWESTGLSTEHKITADDLAESA